MDDEFVAWLSGLIDGEGCFGMGKGNINVPQPRFDITLRDDDLPMLEMIKDTLGFGQVYRRKSGHTNNQGYTSNPVASYVVWNKKDCLKLINVLNDYPPQSKKRRDYDLWSEAVRLWNRRSKSGRWDFRDPELVAAAERMREIRVELSNIREYQAPN